MHLLIFNCNWEIIISISINVYIPILSTFVFLFTSVVKEEIVDDDAHLPCFNGRVVSWVRFKNTFSNIIYIAVVCYDEIKYAIFYVNVSSFFISRVML